MKSQTYTLADEDFLTLLERTDVTFRKLGIPFMFVGGIATQAHIANYLCGETKTLKDLVDSSDFRLQDYFRATDDVDITLDKNGFPEVDFYKKLFEAFKEMRGENDGLFVSPSTDHLVSISMERQGAKRPVFRLGIDKEAQDSERVVAFNLYKGPEDTNERWSQEIRDFEKQNYYDFMNRGVNMAVRYCPGKSIPLRIKRVEDLVATKLIRGRPKDWEDILGLTTYSADAGKPINYEEIGKILCKDDPKYGKPNLVFVEKFEQLMSHVKGHRAQ
jgi:hypothetical protein